jgi:hypothetical protein
MTLHEIESGHVGIDPRQADQGGSVQQRDHRLALLLHDLLLEGAYPIAAAAGDQHLVGRVLAEQGDADLVRLAAHPALQRQGDRLHVGGSSDGHADAALTSQLHLRLSHQRRGRGNPVDLAVEDAIDHDVVDDGVF